MKKTGVFIILLLLFLSLSFVIAQNTTTENNTTTNTTISTSTSSSQDLSKIDKAYECLDSEISSCSSLSIEEISLVLLTNPNTALRDDCKKTLQEKKSSQNCWPSSSCNPKDTALAILALQNLGESTKEAEKWLISQNKSPTDLIWYLQIDSNEATQCSISYDGNDARLNIAENKRLSSSAGPCLTRTSSGFWLQINPECLEKKLIISCDKEFISSILYKQRNSPTIYVSSDTKTAPAYGSIEIILNAKCFGTSGCDYESTVWSALALSKTGNSISNFIPYIVALGDANKQFLPNAFIYMITGYDDYSIKLVQEQRIGNFWTAENTQKGKFYDTGLALLALKSSSSEPVIKARDWALFSQTASGCWQSANTIRDTAILLWALTTRTPNIQSGSSITYCSQAGYFCIPNDECPTGDKLENYFCSGLSTICCKTENLKSCSEYLGKICASSEVCIGNEKRASDTNYCCIGTCEQPRTTSTECEEQGFFCRENCDGTIKPYDCGGFGTCCDLTKKEKSLWWIWLLIILIILTVLGILGYIYIDKLKIWWFKIKSKFRKDKGSGNSSPRPPSPPRPGFPPIRRPMIRPMQMRPAPQRPQPPQKRNPSASDDIFKKLRDMTK